MTAFVVTHHGPDGLNEAQLPRPIGRNDALVDVRTASINPLDKMARNGEFNQLKAGLAGPITALYPQLEQATH